MAGKSVEDVLAQLERVFSGEVQYDEALMDLGLHTAQVRKSCPNLFKVLSGSSSSTPEPNLAGLLKELFAKLDNGQHQEIIPYNPKPPETVSITPEMVPYTVWAKNQAKSSRVGDTWLVGWDIQNNVPLPTVGQSLTLRNDSSKIRFKVNELQDGETMPVMILEAIAILPLSG